MSQAEFPGDTLRARREACGLTLTDVYRRIHVPVEYIRALERGDLDALPGKTYTMGFLKSYCRFLELDPEPLADHFRGCTQSLAQDRLGATARGGGLPARRPLWLSEALAWGAICAILLLGWLTYSAVVRPLAENVDTRVNAGTIEATPPTHFDEDF